MKNCPFCGAEIHELAVMCVHCQRMLDTTPPANTAPNVKICPNCGNECIKEAVICVKCGTSFESLKTPAAKRNTDGLGKIVGIVAIAFAILGVAGGIMGLVSSFSNGYGLTIATSIISFVGTILVCLGFIIRKNNVFPGIGYILAVISSVLNLVLGLICYAMAVSLISFIVVVIAVVQNIIMASLYFNKKPNGRALWFIPVILSVVILMINVIFNFVNGDYIDYGYYYDSFNWQIFIIDIATRIGTVFGILLACANAKLNWHKSVAVASDPVPMDI